MEIIEMEIKEIIELLEIQKELNFSSGQKKKTNVSFKTPVTKINTQKITEKSEPIKSVKSIPSSDKSLKLELKDINALNAKLNDKINELNTEKENLNK